MSKEETWSIASATLEGLERRSRNLEGARTSGARQRWPLEGRPSWSPDWRAPRAPDQISRARHAGTSPGSRRSTGNRGDHKVAPTSSSHRHESTVIAFHAAPTPSDWLK